MKRTLGVVMDPLNQIHPKKDSTLAMLWEAARRDWQVFYFEQRQLFCHKNKPFGYARQLKLTHNLPQWYTIVDEQEMDLSTLDVILMRKDPPVNETYLYATYILEHAENQGVLIVNKPQSLRDANEKLFATYFPDCLPETLVTASIPGLYQFWQTHRDIVCKPLNTMGGTHIFRVKEHDINANVIFETLTDNGARHIMAQQYIPAITEGDKRILLINGEVIPYALSRVPQGRDWRGNLAVGAKGVVQPLSGRDHFICERVKPMLKKLGLYFVGIDIIGDYLTEINVTSPTGIRELDAALNINICHQLFDCIEQLLR